MDRSRSKRSYYYDQDSDSQTPPPRTKSRYSNNNNDYGGGGNHHRRVDRRPPPPSSSSKIQDSPSPSPTVTTVYRILCPDAKAGGVIGKSGSIIKTFRQKTGAWINVHQLVDGDDERIIETSDDRRRDPDGRPPQYSPAQEALLMIHGRILDAELEFGGGDDDDDDDDYGGAWGGDGDRGRATTRLVVPRSHVGCLLGKGGKIIEQMRMATKTHIRILPRDQYTPRCVSKSEEIVQVVGDGNAVKKAVALISSRIKESLHRDRGPFRGRLHSPDRFFHPDDDFMNNAQFRSASEGPDLASRSSGSHSYEDLVFRILCPNDKVESVMGVSGGIIEMLRVDIGVDVRVTDSVPGSDERIITITSGEGPDDELFPAQEALLHIQTHIVDLGPDKDNIITTRLLVSGNEIGCLEGKDGPLSDIRRLASANVQILPKEDLPLCALEGDELVQIVGEIRAARNALVQVTARLRSYLFHEISLPKDLLPSGILTPGNVSGIVGLEPSSPSRSSSREGYQGSEPPTSVNQNMHTATVARQSKDTGRGTSGSFEQEESNINDEVRQSGPKRFIAPLVTKSTLEIIIPEQAVPSLIMRSGSKLAQISEMSGATVSLIEDRPDQTQKVVQISGSPEQAERAQSLLQGFILSTS